MISDGQECYYIMLGKVSEYADRAKVFAGNTTKRMYGLKDIYEKFEEMWGCGMSIMDN